MRRPSRARRRAASALQPADRRVGPRVGRAAPAGRGWAPRSRTPEPRRRWPTTRTATCARATRGRTATSTRDYAETFVFTNDFAALRPDTSMRRVRATASSAPRANAGICRVVCFSPRHDLTLGADDRRRPSAASSMSGPTRPAELGARRTAGSRSSRTAARRWAPRTRIRTARSGPGRRCPARPRARTPRSGATSRATGRRLLLDYVDQEIGRPAGRRGERRLARRRPVLGGLAVRDARDPASGPAARLTDLDDAARDDLAARCSGCSARYDGLFERPFPYSMGWHQAPFGDDVDRRTGSSTPTSIRRSCARPSASSWSATSCSPRPSAT